MKGDIYEMALARGHAIARHRLALVQNNNILGHSISYKIAFQAFYCQAMTQISLHKKTDQSLHCALWLTKYPSFL